VQVIDSALRVRRRGEDRGEAGLTKLTDEQYDTLRAENRARYTLPLQKEPVRLRHEEALTQPDLL
jgi:hypothetical protein